ncbi:MAG: hypothetical protein ABIK96_04735 [bacterium]
MRLIKVTLILAAMALLAVPTLAVTLNEVRIDQGGTDNDEYFELAGMPGESLNGLTLIVIGDGTALNGAIEAAISLDGYSIAADGYFLGVETTYTQTCGEPADATFGTLLNFENSDNVTFMLVSGFTGIVGDDIDLDDDWTIDNVLWSSIIDIIALVETPGTGDAYYGNATVGPDGIYVPGHALVCDGYWVVGSFDLCVTDSPGVDNATICAVPDEKSSFGGVKSMFR